MNTILEENIKKGQKTRTAIMNYIAGYCKEHGYAPSFREIADGIGMSSQSTVKRHIDRLFDAGCLETDLPERFSCPRAFRVSSSWDGVTP